MTSQRNRLRAIARTAMMDRGLRPDFSPNALQEAGAIPGARRADAATRDLRELLWASIDNDDSRDLDQLTVAETGSDGLVKILVGIADVDALVKKGCAIDEHAGTNTTSVYTAAEVFPMLPERLSTDLTSLGQNEDRLAVVVEMTVSEGGEVVEAQIGRALVRNHAKLAYDAVAAWLDGGAPAPTALAAVRGLDEQIRVQDRVAQAMKSLRAEVGALSLETIEPRTLFEGDHLADLKATEKNRAREIIESFMIAANGATARYLERKGFPSMRRVLSAPKRWDRIVDLAAAAGERLPDRPNVRALQQFLTKRRRADRVGFADLSLSVVKLLGSGEYSIELPGRPKPEHFGLAVRDYMHSTAPNRRFPDLVTQRLIKAALSGNPVPYALGELDGLARHCTEQEDDASKVERHVRKAAAALLLEDRVGEWFEGIVTGASEKGTWVRILKPPAEGKVVHGFEGIDVGDRVRVKLIGTDVERGFIDFVRGR
jgi:VacB/RNase II family 3'-5' exoribonuclease